MNVYRVNEWMIALGKFATDRKGTIWEREKYWVNRNEKIIKPRWQQEFQNEEKTPEVKGNSAGMEEYGVVVMLSSQGSPQVGA